MRLSVKPLQQYPWYIRLFFWNQKRRYGSILEPAKLWGRSPKVFAALALLYGALDRRSSPIEPDLRTLVTVRVSQINWCSFCVDINSATALKRGVSQEKLMALTDYKNSDLFNSKEKAALNYAEAITFTDKQPTDEHFNKLNRYFDDDAIAELTGLIAFQNMSSKFNAALDVAPQGFCKLPQEEREGKQ
jgi:AhpD family alkylhydroperoxidase